MSEREFEHVDRVVERDPDEDPDQVRDPDDPDGEATPEPEEAQ